MLIEIVEHELAGPGRGDRRARCRQVAAARWMTTSERRCGEMSLRHEAGSARLVVSYVARPHHRDPYWPVRRAVVDQCESRGCCPRASAAARRHLASASDRSGDCQRFGDGEILRPFRHHPHRVHAGQRRSVGGDLLQIGDRAMLRVGRAPRPTTLGCRHVGRGRLRGIDRLPQRFDRRQPATIAQLVDGQKSPSQRWVFECFNELSDGRTRQVQIVGGRIGCRDG